MVCIVCGQEVNEFGDYELFGVDGDVVHIKCKPAVNRAMSAIDNMDDKQFERYMRGQKNI